MINFGSAFLDAEIRRRSSAAWQHVEEWVEKSGLEPGDDRVGEYRRKYFAENHPGYADLDTVVDHVMHVIDVAGIDHVGLGSDFDGVGDSLPTGLKDVSQYPNLIAALMERGLSEQEIEKICSGNVFRVMREAARVAASSAGS